MRSNLYAKTTLASLLCLFSIFGCSESKNQSSSQPEAISGSETTSNSENTNNSISENVVAENEVLTEKDIPTLGSATTQLQFESEDSMAILQGRPRPTYPETLAVLAGNPPPGTDVCNLEYSALIKAMYDSCFPEGISYVAMSNIIGWAGKEISRSGETVIYSWGGGDRGTLTATFTDGRLTAKSQDGLK